MLKIEKRFTKLFCFYENKLHFYPIILVNLTQLSPSGLVPSTSYIPQCFCILVYKNDYYYYYYYYY